MFGVKRANLTVWLFLLPALAAVVFILLYPMVDGIVMSFTNRFFSYDNYSFVGLQNYQLIKEDPVFRRALVNTVRLTSYTIILNTAIGFGLACLVNSAGSAGKFFRILYFVPWILPSTVVAFAFRWLYNDSYGYINYLLLKWHLIAQPVNPLVRSELVWPAIIIPSVWFSYPFVMLVFAAALKSIHPSIYEAAQIDGASRSQTFWKITLPAMKSTFMMVTILQIIWEFASFDLVYLMTRGGPANSTLTLSVYIYKMAFEYKKIGYACAMATAMFVILAVVIILCFIIYKYGEKER